MTITKPYSEAIDILIRYVNTDVQNRIIFVAKKDNIILYMTITKPNSERTEILIRYMNTGAVKIGLFLL